MATESDQAQFTRQRRFLVIVSLLLVAKYVAAIEVGKSIQVLGAGFEITRPAAALAGLWVVWLWALIRYGQYFRAVGRVAISRAKNVETHHVAMKMIRRSLNKQIAHPGIEYNGQRLRGRVTQMFFPFYAPDTRVESGWFRDEFAEYQEGDDGTRTYRQVTAQIESKGRPLHMHTFTPTVDRKELKRAGFWAWWRYVLRTHYFSEYYAPFFIAAAAPATAIAATLCQRYGC